jgi:hypothetical protein
MEEIAQAHPQYIANKMTKLYSDVRIQITLIKVNARSRTFSPEADSSAGERVVGLHAVAKSLVSGIFFAT